MGFCAAWWPQTEARWYLESSVQVALPRARDAWREPGAGLHVGPLHGHPERYWSRRNFGTKVRRVVGELWVSYLRTKMVEISHSISIFRIMNTIIGSIYRISIGARKAKRPVQMSWFTWLATSWWRTCTTRCVSRPSLCTAPSSRRGVSRNQPQGTFSHARPVLKGK